MVSIEEMEQAVEQIRKYCELYDGKHVDIFHELGRRLSRAEREVDIAVDVRSRMVKDQYNDAISTLLGLAQPPNSVGFENVLANLSEMTGEQVADVYVLEEDAQEGFLLSSGLPRPRRTTKIARELVDEFRQQLPAPQWTSRR